MAKYNMEKNGAIFRNSIMPGDTPVIVLPEADWRRLVELVRFNTDAMLTPEIGAIIEKAEADNG